MRPFDSNGVFLLNVHAGEGGLRRVAVRAAGITTLTQALALVVQVVATVVLARLLDPAAFGIVAMVTTFSLLFSNFGGNGFTEAVVQREEINHRLASNLFWLNTGICALLAMGFAAGGVLLGRLYHDSRVVAVTEVMALTIIVTGVSVIHLALLRRAMRFSLVAVGTILGQASSVGVSILLALRGWGYWALVAGAIASPLAASVVAWLTCQWIPARPSRGAGTRPAVRYAMNIYGFFTLNYVTRNLDNLLAGWLFGPQALGLYKKAYDLASLPFNQISTPLTAVAVPTLSRLKDERERHRRYLLRCFSILAFVGMGLAAYLTLVGHDLVRLLLGPKWGETGKIFMFFGPGIGALFLYGLNGWIHLSIGRSDRYLKWGFVHCAGLALLLVVGTRWGARGLAAAWSLYFCVMTIPAIWYAGRPVEFHIRPVLATVWKYVVACLLASACGAVVIQRLSLVLAGGWTGAAIRLALVTLSFGVSYVLLVVLLHRGGAPVVEAAVLLREMLPWTRGERTIAGSKDGNAKPPVLVYRMAQGSGRNGR